MATNYTCLLYRLYTLGPNDYMYYANYYESGCNVDPWPFAIQAGAVSGLPQSCPETCIPDTMFAARAQTSDEMPTVEHYAPKTFQGFDPALHADYTPTWENGITAGAPTFKIIHFPAEGRSYKAKVFDVTLPNKKSVYVAFEVDAVPAGEKASIINARGARRGVGRHSYSIQSVGGKGMIFLADVDG